MLNGMVGICTRVYWQITYTRDNGTVQTFIEPAYVVRRPNVNGVLTLRLTYAFEIFDMQSEVMRQVELIKVTPEHRRRFPFTYRGIERRSICQRTRRSVAQKKDASASRKADVRSNVGGHDLPGP